MTKFGAWLDRVLGIDNRPYRGDVKVARVGSPKLIELLTDHYEPFAVDDGYVFLRKLVLVE